MIKYISFHLLCVFILVSCAGKQNKSEIATSNDTPETTVATEMVQPSQEQESTSLSITARFIDFTLGDAEHYTFEDESGKIWDFAGSNEPSIEFAQELPEDEANTDNQGWGSNKTLEGKWFALTYIQREQPEYIDGPIVTVNIIDKAKILP